jgi:hypothetical protein
MQSLWPFLTRELRDAPGRANYTLRLTLSCAVLIVLFMTLHIPFLAVALIVVFYVSQPNVLMIKLVSVVFVVTVSIALGGVLLIIKWTYDYPLIRLVASVILFFCAIYLMRVLGKLGLAFFVVALAVIYAQTFPSMTSQSEILVRLLLWLWVAINTAILVTLLVNACFQQAFPGYQFKARLVVMLRQTAKVLSQPDAGEPQPTFTEIAGQFNQLQSLYQQAARATPEIAANPQAWQSLMAAALSCYHLTALLQPGDDHPDARRRIASQLNALADNLPTAADVQPLIVPRDGANSAILQEIAEGTGAAGARRNHPTAAGRSGKSAAAAAGRVVQSGLSALCPENAAGDLAVLRFLHRHRLAGHSHHDAELRDRRPAGAGRHPAENVATHRRRAVGHVDCAAIDRLCAALDRLAERPAGDDPAGLRAGGVDCGRLGAHRLRRDPDRLYLCTGVPELVWPAQQPYRTARQGYRYPARRAGFLLFISIYGRIAKRRS